MKPEMKKMMAQKMMEKIGSIDPADIEAVTIQLVLSGAPMEGKMSGKPKKGYHKMPDGSMMADEEMEDYKEEEEDEEEED